MTVVPTHEVQIKDEVYALNLDEYKSIERHWVGFYVNGDNVTYFNSFGVEFTPKRMKDKGYKFTRILEYKHPSQHFNVGSTLFQRCRSALK